MPTRSTQQRVQSLRTVVLGRSLMARPDAGAAAAIESLEQSRPDLVHRVLGMTFVGFRLPPGSDPEASRAAAAEADLDEAMAGVLPPEALAAGLAVLNRYAVIAVETDAAWAGRSGEAGSDA